MNYENQDATYKLFLLDEAYHQQIMNLYIEEAILWVSGNMTKEKLIDINESVKDTVKQKIKDAWEFVMKTLRTVSNRVSNFIKSRKSFLTDNKDIIIGKKVIYQEDFTLYPYTEGVNRMSKYKIPPFDYEKIKKINPDGDFYGEVLSGYFNFTAFESTKDDLSDKCKDYFRGGEEKTYTAAQLNMTDLYNTCLNYEDKIEKSFQDDLNVIEDSKSKIDTAISKIKVNENSYLFNDNLPIYSYFLESYININEQPTNTDTPEPETDNISGKTKNTAVHTAGEQIKNNKMNKGDNTHPDSEKLQTDTSDGNKDEVLKLQNQCKLYFDTARIITEAKMSIAKEMYDKYFDIIDKHVKSYGGQKKDDTEGNKPTETGSDFNNTLDAAAKKALENQKGISKVEIAHKNDNKNNSNSDKYLIRITHTDSSGNTQIDCQDVETIYPGDSTGNLEFVPGSIQVKRANNGIWQIQRKYNIKNGGGTKIMASYINLKKSILPSSNFIEDNMNVSKTS